MWYVHGDQHERHASTSRLCLGPVCQALEGPDSSHRQLPGYGELDSALQELGSILVAAAADSGGPWGPMTCRDIGWSQRSSGLPSRYYPDSGRVLARRFSIVRQHRQPPVTFREFTERAWLHTG